MSWLLVLIVLQDAPVVEKIPMPTKELCEAAAYELERQRRGNDAVCIKVKE